jgi:L-serine dehydratase
MTQLIGLFDLFRIGLGPSSSHTVGPMRAARSFVLGAARHAGQAARVQAFLYGSLAWTGRGHGTDVAILAGLAGMEPATADPDAVRSMPGAIAAAGAIEMPGLGRVSFSLETDLVFDMNTLVAGHPNAMRFVLTDAAGVVLSDELWFSVGGGHTVLDGQMAQTERAIALPYPFAHGSEMLAMAERSGMSIAELQFANEVAVRPAEEVHAHIAHVLEAMESCIDRGLAGVGELPGGLKVRRRAATLAVNEENAVGGRVVTAPTNGAAGVIPAVLRYWRTYHDGATPEAAAKFLLAAAAVGGLAKRNASISGAEVGCQGEVGVACAMAAAGLASALGGTAAQVENAAEIGLEHHLGMTCDPIGGLVQIPCIERNAMGAVKAINAASLALSGDGVHRVSLDEAIATMRQTGLDMRSEYKETAQGGLAVHVTEC